MAGLSAGLKKKLRISPCKVDTAGNISVDSSKKSFEVMLNPSDYKHHYSICYNKKEDLGQSASEPKFSNIEEETVTIGEIVIDGTGVVNLPIPGVGSPDVKTQIQQLKDVVYTYKGDIHQPNYVRLLWGSLIFFGRMKSMSVNYTLFKPSGEPLRAKVQNLSFGGFMSKEERSLRANKSSPDQTHIVEFKAGDTLPLLCYRIYKDSSYYPEVARANNIVNFRDIKPGTKLYLHPLR
jgi:hypothetical protein